MPQTDFTQAFFNTVESRNTAQRKAIESTEGPVLVLAGPGTGKTDVLSLRIGHILQSTDTDPHHILCLTYTESGALAMRQRLAEYIGSAAYNVHIHTFHAFCNLVIQENPQYFGFYRELQPLSDLEKVELLMDIVDSLPHEHVLRRLKGDMYYESKRMGKLFDLMKRENWSPEFMKERIDKYIEEQRESDEFICKRKTGNYVKGDFRDDHFQQRVLDKMDLLTSAIDLFGEYQGRMRSLERYDFNDMLRWVFEAFGEHPMLLSTYQERFLYILVDEFQDTNGLQMDILRQLLSYWEEQPNVFVVGDDDQSIYRFQGANVDNIVDFQSEYEPLTVVLTENYRSTQNVLDAAMDLIVHNQERLVHYVPGLSKTLVAAAPWGDASDSVRIVQYENSRHELATIAEKLVGFRDQGILQKEDIAVIYRRHSQAEELVKVLARHKVPVEMRRKVNILVEPFIQNLLLVVRYFWENYRKSGSTENILYRMMHFRCFGIPPRDIAALSVHTLPSNDEEKRKRLRNVLDETEAFDSIGIRDIEALTRFSEFLRITEAELFEDTFQVFFEKLLTRSGILEFMYTSPDRRSLFQMVTALFDMIKAESEKDPRLGFEQFLEMIDKLEMHGIPIAATQITQQPDGVHFMTAHSAKGLQFDRVFLLDCTERNWEKQRASSREYSLPSTLVPASKEVSEEDERRLFYVAMTRAKKDLEVSYARFNLEDKEQSRSKFVEEVVEGGNAVFTPMEADEDQQVNFIYDNLHFTSKDPPQFLDHELIDTRLEQFALSVTAVNKYLECPVKFYFENILRIPAARNVYMGFGSAVHSALEHFFDQYYADQGKGVEILLKSFDEAMQYYRSHFTEMEFENRSVYGREILTDYYNQYHKEWRKPDSFYPEHKIRNVEYSGIPVTGFLDKVEVFGKDVIVTDYKTGKYRAEKFYTPSEKSEYGGDYWRQLVFYNILILADPHTSWKMEKGVIDFVEPQNNGRFYRKELVVTAEDISIVTDQIKEVYAAILRHDFEEGCGSDDCYWCNLVASEFSMRHILMPEDREVE